MRRAMIAYVLNRHGSWKREGAWRHRLYKLYTNKWGQFMHEKTPESRVTWPKHWLKWEWLCFDSMEVFTVTYTVCDGPESREQRRSCFFASLFHWTSGSMPLTIVRVSTAVYSLPHNSRVIFREPSGSCHPRHVGFYLTWFEYSGVLRLGHRWGD